MAAGGLRSWLPEAILAVVQGPQCTRLPPVSRVAGFLFPTSHSSRADGEVNP